jgi:hypothetical protein
LHSCGELHRSIAVRTAIEDEVYAILSQDDTADAAQKNADELLRPYVDETGVMSPARARRPSRCSMRISGVGATPTE